MRVLVVEDDAGIAGGLVAMLKGSGYAVDHCATLAHAWAALQTEAFDLMLLDVGLPDMDGREAVKILRREGFKSPIRFGADESAHDIGRVFVAALFGCDPDHRETGDRDPRKDPE